MDLKKYNELQPGAIHDFKLDSLFMYELSKPENDARTRKRLQQIKELGMSYFNGEFFIKDVVSGLYIERVWSYSDKEFADYMEWVREIIKEKVKQ